MLGPPKFDESLGDKRRDTPLTLNLVPRERSHGSRGADSSSGPVRLTPGPCASLPPDLMEGSKVARIAPSTHKGHVIMTRTPGSCPLLNVAIYLVLLYLTLIFSQESMLILASPSSSLGLTWIMNTSLCIVELLSSKAEPLLWRILLVGSRFATGKVESLRTSILWTGKTTHTAMRG